MNFEDNFNQDFSPKYKPPFENILPSLENTGIPLKCKGNTKGGGGGRLRLNETSTRSDVIFYSIATVTRESFSCQRFPWNEFDAYLTFQTMSSQAGSPS